MNGFSSTISREERERNKFPKSSRIRFFNISNKSEITLRKYIEKKYGDIK